MSREIKFRALRNGEWFYGSLIKMPNEYVKTGYQVFIVPDCEPGKITLSGENRIDISAILCESGTEGLYADQKDKNGIQIYRGDVIRYDGGNYDVISEVKFSMGAFYVGSSIPGGLLCRISVPEIIGNVWEHPHLLEPSK